VSDAKPEKLTLGLKLLYGAPSVAGAAMAIPVAIHVNPFYSDTVLVPLAWVALAAALARVLDAIIDPFVGWLSDHTHTRWGRRRPWIAVAAPIAALVFIALFTPPESLSTQGAAVWFGATLMMFFILNMLYGLPHAALGPELTLDYHERSSLFSWREGFALVGTLVAAVVPGILISTMGDERRAYAEMAIAYGVLMVSLYWLLVWRVRERPDFVRRKSNPLVPGVRRSLRNRPFAVLFGCYVVASIPGAIPGLMMPYFSRYVLNPPPLPAGDAQGWLSVFLAAYFLSGLLCLPLWLALAKRIGKLNAWLASFVMGITGGLALFLLGPGDNIECVVVIAWAGSSFGAGNPSRRDRLRRIAHRQTPRGAVPLVVGAGAEIHRDPECVAAARVARVARLPAERAAVARCGAGDPDHLCADAGGVLDCRVLHCPAFPDR